MTDHAARLKAFVKLGTFFQDFYEYYNKSIGLIGKSNSRFDEFQQKIELAKHNNGWFTEDNILFSIKEWSNLLTNETLEDWLNRYNNPPIISKNIAIIMAGNIPLVGFHDFLTVIILGHKAVIKQSSNDTVLLPLIANYLIEIEPSLKDKIEFTTSKLEDFDAVIATGSTNTARYFEYYFAKKPNIIRKSRNSVAVLTGNETTTQLTALANDIFKYYGLGCRSVSKLVAPKNYNFDSFFKAMFEHKDIMNIAKYANNYDYNKAVYLMSEFKLLDNGFLILKEDKSYSSPIATLFYESYNSINELKQTLEQDSEKLQCIVANGLLPNEVKYGETQCPSLVDYADGVDTVDFLLKI